MKTYRHITATVAALIVVALLGVPSVSHATAWTTTTFSGRATVVQGQVAGITVGPIVDTGPVSSGGGELEASLLDYPVTGLPDPANGALHAQILHAAVVAHGNKSSAEAFVARLSESRRWVSRSVRMLFWRARARPATEAARASPGARRSPVSRSTARRSR